MRPISAVQAGIFWSQNLPFSFGRRDVENGVVCRQAASGTASQKADIR